MPEDNEEIQARPTLQKGNIILRAPQPSDRQELRSFVQYPEISRMYGRALKEERPITEEAALNWYRQMCGDPLRWFIEIDGKLVGTTGFHTLIKDDRKARFVIGLFRPALLNKVTGPPRPGCFYNTPSREWACTGWICGCWPITNER